MKEEKNEYAGGCEYREEEDEHRHAVISYE
jgi:hypothetical protein